MSIQEKLSEQNNRLKFFISAAAVDNDKLYLVKLIVLKILDLERTQLILQLQRNDISFKLGVKLCNDIDKITDFINNMGSDKEAVKILADMIDVHIHEYIEKQR